ncbi:protein kinase [Yoonia sp. BS5-3]|uniref:Protein kinase n=1 Tax=Yoonia phaeophyticola TaxID=3137369 RepID=A0ABZ2V7J6_9RHOB
MTQISVSLGQASSKGRKAVNQDFHGALVPNGRAMSLKGITVALADGISTSDVSHIAAETAVKSLLTDYYATPDSWAAQTAVSTVINATNSWLHAQTAGTPSGEVDRGYVCTLAALILKARQAHLFHVGDSRIWRVSGGSLEPLTVDHQSMGMLSAAMGARQTIEISYKSVPLAQGDVFLLTSDGVHDFWTPAQVVAQIAAGDLQAAADDIVAAAHEADSPDNMTVQIVRIDALPTGPGGINTDDLTLPFPPIPNAGDILDGYEILRALHGNHRSHLYLAKAPDGMKVALKIPGSETRDDPEQLRRFVLEEWIARRLSNPHLLSAPPPLETPRAYLYSVTEYIEGQTLRQWMADNPQPSLEQVRDIIEQTVKGLRSFHRREMLHQDIRPENIMITDDGVVKLIDFGAAYVAGVQEAAPFPAEAGILGTYQYTAPEYFSNEAVSFRSDMFSIGVIAYEMLTGYLPYGTQIARIRTPRDRAALRYRSAQGDARVLAPWMDEALSRAVHADPYKRYETFSDFIKDLRTPSAAYQKRHARPLMERDPLKFWQCLSIALAILSIALAVQLSK